MKSTEPIGSYLMLRYAENSEYMENVKANAVKAMKGDWSGAASGFMGQNPELVMGLMAALFGGLTNKNNRLGGALGYMLPAVILPYLLRRNGLWNQDTVGNITEGVKSVPGRAQDWAVDTADRISERIVKNLPTEIDPKTGRHRFVMNHTVDVPVLDRGMDYLGNLQEGAGDVADSIGGLFKGAFGGGGDRRTPAKPPAPELAAGKRTPRKTIN